MIRKIAPNAIDSGKMHVGEQILKPAQIKENLELAINSALSLGCDVESIKPKAIAKGRPGITLKLLAEIFKVLSFHHPCCFINPSYLKG